MSAAVSISADLFGELAAAGGPRGGAPRGKRGRGATSRIVETWTAPRLNPSGRRSLTLSFRPLRRHQEPVAGGAAPRWQVACELIRKYFQVVGGFRQAGDETVRVWADALAEYTPEQIRQAIVAKAGSLQSDDAAEAAFRATFRGRPETFPARLPYWLDVAEREVAGERARAARPVEDAALREHLGRLRHVEPSIAVEAQPGDGSDGVAVGSLESNRGGLPAAGTGRRAILAQHAADAARGAESYAAVWAATLPRRRLLIERALRADFADYVHVFDPALDAAAPELWPLWLTWCARESLARYGAPAAEPEPGPLRPSAAGDVARAGGQPAGLLFMELNAGGWGMEDGTEVPSGRQAGGAVALRDRHARSSYGV